MLIFTNTKYWHLLNTNKYWESTGTSSTFTLIMFSAYSVIKMCNGYLGCCHNLFTISHQFSSIVSTTYHYNTNILHSFNYHNIYYLPSIILNNILQCMKYYDNVTYKYIIVIIYNYIIIFTKHSYLSNILWQQYWFNNCCASTSSLQHYTI